MVQNLYARRGKRVLDVVVVVLSAPVAVPLAAAGWMAARVSTGGGLFTQLRVGRGGNLFKIWKLQSMVPAGAEDDQEHQFGVTTSRNHRIPRTGAVLRRTKLDELPQLWNVVRGDMSIVGPRPDVPRWLDLWKAADQALDVRPGLISLASLAYFDEESLLAKERDPVATYGNEILPHKLVLTNAYATHLSLALDLRLVALAAMALWDHQRALPRIRRLIQDLS